MRRLHFVIPAIWTGLALLTSTISWAGPYVQTNLVSDIPGLAQITDPNLKNPWGVSHSPTSPFWVSDAGTSVVTLYSVTTAGVAIAPLVVANPTGPPTGQVFNNTSSFPVNGTAAAFIFANLNGTISAWNGGTAAQIEATTPGAVYTGLAISSGPFLYAANPAQDRIDVFDGSFTDITSTVFAGKFIDPVVPAGLFPFNVQNIGGEIYVTYAPGAASASNATEGEGAVAVFDENGNFIDQLISGSKLASPWGITLAPAGFGPFGGDLLVGNFSSVASEINAFNPTNGTFLGTISIGGPAYSPGGLWFLGFGNSGSNGSPDTLFITDGINGQRDGLFAAIKPAPEPNTLALFAAGILCAIGFRHSVRSRGGSRTLGGSLC